MDMAVLLSFPGALSDAVGSLKKLETLLLQHNRLQVLPSTVANMTALRDINVSHNQLLDFPISLCNLRHLNSVDLSGNRIRQVPDDVKTLQAVELNINQNQVRTAQAFAQNNPNVELCRLND